MEKSSCKRKFYLLTLHKMSIIFKRSRPPHPLYEIGTDSTKCRGLPLAYSMKFSRGPISWFSQLIEDLHCGNSLTHDMNTLVCAHTGVLTHVYEN